MISRMRTDVQSSPNFYEFVSHDGTITASRGALKKDSRQIAVSPLVAKYRKWDLNPHEVYPHGILNPRNRCGSCQATIRLPVFGYSTMRRFVLLNPAVPSFR